MRTCRGAGGDYSCSNGKYGVWILWHKVSAMWGQRIYENLSFCSDHSFFLLVGECKFLFLKFLQLQRPFPRPLKYHNRTSACNLSVRVYCRR